MQHIVTEVFEVLGGVTALARGTGQPPQTVSDWKNKGGEIPPWRRPAVVDFARREGKLSQLSDDAIRYLQSDVRKGQAA